MPTTVGQHPVNPYTTPQNGDPNDADVVRGHLNTLRNAYVAHDEDTGIHLQSAGSLPPVGPTGAKILVGRTLYMSNGTVWLQQLGRTYNITNGESRHQRLGEAGDITIDWNDGPVQLIGVAGNITSFLTPLNPQLGGRYTLIFVQDGTGGHSVSLTGAIFRFGDGSWTTLGVSPVPNSTTIIELLYTGTIYCATMRNFNVLP
jgi:hypothetical protein